MSLTPRFIDQFDVLLFDLMDTLMMGGNRFSDREDYAHTYRQLGGTFYPDEAVQQLIHQTWSRMSAHYHDPAWYADFRPAGTYLAETLNAHDLPHNDLPRLHTVFAHHELGHVPEPVCQTLRTLSQTHRLGIVSDLWAEKALFVRTLRRCHIHHLFGTTIFSSDYGTVKPAPTLFQLALDALNADPPRALFIGDSIARDMAGAGALGLGTLLVTGGEPDPDYPGPQVRDVPALLTR